MDIVTIVSARSIITNAGLLTDFSSFALSGCGESPVLTVRPSGRREIALDNNGSGHYIYFRLLPLSYTEISLVPLVTARFGSCKAAAMRGGNRK